MKSEVMARSNGADTLQVYGKTCVHHQGEKEVSGTVLKSEI